MTKKKQLYDGIKKREILDALTKQWLNYL